MGNGIGWRQQALARLADGTFDVAIIGAGITGAGVARDAALRGLRVALIDRGDFASGTSSRSSRLVHGGVRYLEHGHLHLVFEASRERRILLRIAPHLVRPLIFTWPVYRGARISRLKLSLGLGLYDALAMFGNVGSHQRLSRSAVLDAEPALQPAGLLGGARYYDAATNDARLTLANVIAASEAGAVVLNHAEARGIVITAGSASGLEVHDRHSGADFLIRARQVVNAAGPWSDDVRSLEMPVKAPAVTGSKGAHISVPRARVGHRNAITMIHPRDGRVLFTLPAGDFTIIGTTETPTPEAEREVTASREDVRYLLEGASAYFPRAQLSDGDVVSAWAGIRPLARSLSGSDVGSASREHHVERGPGGVLHVTGGKLTTYRSMAADVVDRLTGVRSDRRFGTATLPLPGGDVQPRDLEPQAAAIIADTVTRERILRSYGSRWRGVWQLTMEDGKLGQPMVPDHPVTGAEVLYAVSHEMAITLGDILLRRTHAAFELPDHGRSLAPAVAALVAPFLGWRPDEVNAALLAYDQEAEVVFG